MKTTRAADFMRAFLRRWLRSGIPAALFVGALLVTAFAYLHGAAMSAVILSTCGCIACAFLWGYSVRMGREWPRLHRLRRGDYSLVWDGLGTSATAAANAATGISDEEPLRASGRNVADRIADLVSLAPGDAVLEIGSGVGRVGWALAPRCRTWTGCDISGQMLKYAQQRLAAFDNVRFVQLSGAQLAGVADQSIDVVYCTNMLPHLDEMERWQYVREAYRVLRNGGRLYLDSIALASPEGWAMLTNNLEQRRFGTEPPYMPLPSTGEELAAYCRQAGFDALRILIQNSLLIVTGTKAVAASASES